MTQLRKFLCCIHIPGAKGRAAGPPVAIHIADLEVGSVKKFILDYKRKKCPRQLHLNIQQFILEEQLEVFCDKDVRENGDIVE